MKQVQTILALLVIGVVISSAQSARAQYRSGISSPTLSPWLNLYRRNAGPLGSYLSDVRPEQRFRSTLQQHNTSLQRQGAGLRVLGQQMSTYERTGSIRPTGTGSGFMNYSHYYVFPGTPAGRRTSSRPIHPPHRPRGLRSF